MDTVHAASGRADGLVIAKAISQISAQESALRVRVLDFLGWAAEEQLTAAIPELTGQLLELTQWLLAARHGQTTAGDITAKLSSSDRLTRSFAAAAAAIFSESDRSPLEQAATSSDADVRTFSAHELAASPQQRALRRRVIRERGPQ